MRIDVEALDEEEPGPIWLEAFQRHAEAYLRWYGSPGGGARPTFLECETAIARYLPEWFATWKKLCELVGGGDLEARFLSLYRPPPYVHGCSQAVLTRPQPLLVRNYDYAPQLWDAMLLRSSWNGQKVLALTDCWVGALDGVNESGLAISLSFGGSPEVGIGFGAPLVLRVALELCQSAFEAARLFRRVPIHMAYNVVMIDRTGDFYTAFTAPNRPTIVRRTPASTNHQDRIAWPQHAHATATIERERQLYARLADPSLRGDALVAAFLAPPLRSVQYARGFGTLYTAAYRPTEGELVLHWPGETWRHTLDHCDVGSRSIELPGSRERSG